MTEVFINITHNNQQLDLNIFNSNLNLLFIGLIFNKTLGTYVNKDINIRFNPAQAIFRCNETIKELYEKNNKYYIKDYSINKNIKDYSKEIKLNFKQNSEYDIPALVNNLNILYSQFQVVFKINSIEFINYNDTKIKTLEEQKKFTIDTLLKFRRRRRDLKVKSNTREVILINSSNTNVRGVNIKDCVLVYVQNTIETSVALAHELAHSFGVKHDNCTCINSYNEVSNFCIMSEYSYSKKKIQDYKWSTCSIESILNYFKTQEI